MPFAVIVAVGFMVVVVVSAFRVIRYWRCWRW